MAKRLRSRSKTKDLEEDEPKIGAKRRRAQTTGTLLPHDSSGIADKQPPVAGKKSYDVGHGIRFQSKLLMLFAIRAIIREYPSHLGTELPELGGKFDDLIFHVQEKDDNDKRRPWRILYLQAKHRLYEENSNNQITEKQLISEKNNDFNLPKYFRSYLEIRKRGNDAIKNCIICTNVGFANKFLNKAPNKLDNGIKLVELAKTEWEKEIFNFGEKQSCFKLEITDISKCRMWLKDSCTDAEMKGFFDKLIFVIKTPNERELDLILEREVGTILKLSNAVFPSAYILKELTNWFKDKNNKWLSPDEARRFFLEKTKVIMNSTNITSISIDNQDQFLKTLKFNDNAIRELRQKLELFWKNSKQKIQYITSETPELSVVKITSALKTLPNFQNIDDFLVMLSNRIKDYIDKLIKALIVEKCHHIMVIIENHQNSTISYDNLIPKNGNKKIIVITNNQNFGENKLAFEDTVIYEHLSDECKKFIQTKEIQFQGKIQAVSQLLNNTTDDLISKVMNSSAIQNLLQMNEDKKIEIPSFTATSNYERSLYIKRQITYPFNEQFLADLANQLKCTVHKLQGDFKIDSKGKIEWLTQIKQQKLQILESIKSVLKHKPFTPSTIISENDLMKDQENAKIIITGVAGTGKSTFLSHYYEIMKKLTPDYWIIQISLMNHSDSFYRLKVDEINQTNAIEFFVNLPAVGVDQSSFSQSLLRHRLETGNRIMLMLDGFDEVDYKCQCIVIKLIKALNKSIRLFVTTRSHMAVRLELELSQLAYSLVKFDRKDQIDYLTSLWEKYLNQIMSYTKERPFINLLPCW